MRSVRRIFSREQGQTYPEGGWRRSRCRGTARRRRGRQKRCRCAAPARRSAPLPVAAPPGSIDHQPPKVGTTAQHRHATDTRKPASTKWSHEDSRFNRTAGCGHPEAADEVGLGGQRHVGGAEAGGSHQAALQARHPRRVRCVHLLTQHSGPQHSVQYALATF